ncbi:unnamed protein product [Arabis nemorensis]|uniref:Transposase MuDR plant domain-containing protein n=1 Tax=Arabis nemorensis TaxID=586526 RepID=A0A565BJM3_9BRAS|nr:unnamed protein product [Arabis nemorensis]
MAVDWWSIKRRQKCTLRATEKDVYTFECGRWKCKWSLWAAKMKEHGLVEVTKYTGPHTCRPYNREHTDYEEEFIDDLERVNADFVAYEIERVNAVHPTLSFAELKKWWKGQFGNKLVVYDEEGEAHDTKRLMQDAKKKAIKGVFGGWDRSFRSVPKLMFALHSSNGLLVDSQFDSFLNPESASFRSVFWAFPQSIEGFQHCRSLILVDTKSLGKCSMKLMIAPGVDAANKYFSLAFGVTKQVSTDSWRWFLSGIREKVTQRQDVTPPTRIRLTLTRLAAQQSNENMRNQW